MKNEKYIIIGISLLIFIPQSIIFGKEFSEIDTYTKSSLSIHKKMDFNYLFEYLNSVEDLDKRTLVADYHSAFTLIEKGFKVKYILITEKRNLSEKKGSDPYFNIPYLIYSEDSLKDFIKGKKYIFVIRDFESFNGIDSVLKKNSDFEKPQVFINE